MNLTLPTQPVALFDAVGTVIFPARPVAEFYAITGKNHGSRISVNDIQSRFPPAFFDQFQRVSPRFNQPSSDLADNQKWRRVVKTVFQQDFTETLFDDLWNLFAQPSSWSLDPDLKAMIEQLHAQNTLVGIASNFDSRLRKIIQDLIPEIPADHIFYSTGIGYAKPDIRFYKSIESSFETIPGRPEFLMIGDHWENDVEAAQRAGWMALWKKGPKLPTVTQISHYFFRKT